MCGLNVVFSLNPEVPLSDADKYQISLMSQSTIHRGPDFSDTYESHSCLLAHNRLGILSLEPNSNQPFTSAVSRSTVVFNGEIYNYKKMRNKCIEKGYNFRTNSDTEVIIACYDLFQFGGLDELEGMYSFAIYDISSNKLILRRDPIGIKPLFYTFFENKFYASSEISALRTLHRPHRLNSLALASSYLLEYNCFNESFLVDCFSVEPGNQLVVDKYGHQNTSFATTTESSSMAKCLHTLDNLLACSVNSHLNADVPVCMFYSGGIDSTILAHYARMFDQNIHLFSYLPARIDSFNDDILFAERRAKLLGLKNFSYVSTSDDELLSLFHLYTDHFFSPICDPAIIPTMWMSKCAKDLGYKVVLTGDGADEIFGGYRRYTVMRLLDILKFIMPFLAPIASNNSQNSRFFSILQLCSTSTPTAELFIQLLSIHNISSFSHGSVFESDSLPIDVNIFSEISDHLSSLIDSISAFSYVHQLSMLDMNTILPYQFLPKVDSSTSIFGIEARVPFLDINIVNYAIANQLSTSHIPASKPFLRALAAKIISPEVSRIPKQGFGSPIRFWLSTTFYDFAYFLFESTDFLNYGINCSKQCLLSSLENLKYHDHAISQYKIVSIWRLFAIASFIHSFDKQSSTF